MNIISIDIGGTKIAVAVGNEQGELRSSARFPCNPNAPEATLNQALETLETLLQETGLTLKEIDAAGLSIPGPMSVEKGLMLDSPNMKGWIGFPIADFFRERMPCPVFINNDANGAGLAEYFFGAQKGKDLIYLTMSTGIGAGIIVNGRLVQGVNDCGGEAGHIILNPDGPLCGCGMHGCLEAYCGGKSCAKHLKEEIIAQEIETAILQEANGNPEKISMKEFCNAVRKGDAYACRKWDEYTERLAQGIAGMLHCFNPAAVVLGTIAIFDGDLLLPPLRAKLPKYAWPQVTDCCVIEASALKNIGELAGLAIGLDGLRLS